MALGTDKLLILETVRRLEEGLDRIDRVLSLLTRKRLWESPNTHLVSVGNVIEHLCGNISQWVLAGLGGRPYTRHRSDEFTIKSGASAKTLGAKIRTVIEEAVSVVESLTPADLARLYSVQGFEETGVGILVHVTEHLSYHVGQITFYVKLVENTDVGYYDGVPLDKP